MVNEFSLNNGAIWRNEAIKPVPAVSRNIPALSGSTSPDFSRPQWLQH